jgi:8-oxo-dGTP diphosphatase
MQSIEPEGRARLLVRRSNWPTATKYNSMATMARHVNADALMADQSLAFERPLTTVDVVIFTVREAALQVLLVKRHAESGDPFPGHWALPGGFIDTARDRDLPGCALRKLREKTGVEAPYLEQLGSWGSATRDPRGWSATHAYFALIPSNHLDLTPGGNAADSRWFSVDGDRIRQTLAFDHAILLKAAIARLRAKVEYTSLPAFLMQDEFTLTELQHMYETILARELEKKAFRTRLLSADILEPVARMKSGANRPAQLYRLKRKRQPHLFARPFGSAQPPP